MVSRVWPSSLIGAMPSIGEMATSLASMSIDIELGGSGFCSSPSIASVPTGKLYFMVDADDLARRDVLDEPVARARRT